jgi:tripartite-type tricarboxylate transporter receptor subunit TctC
MKRAALTLILLSLVASGVAAAQSYPAKIVRVVVPYPPGGSVDAVARIVTQRLGEAFGQQFIVDNRAGAAGTIGADFVTKAQPDGYTLMLTASIHVISSMVMKNVPYDAVRDFAPVTQIAAGPLLVLAHPSVAAKDLAELFRDLKEKPDAYTFATSSYGSAGHLAAETLKHIAGVDTLLVAYKGSGPALTDLMGGQVNLMCEPILSSLPLVKAGKLRALAVTSTQRVAVAPEIPTVAESGVPGFDFYSWYGLWGPKGLPREITATLYQAVAKIVADNEVRDRLAAQGFEPVGSSPEEFGRYIGIENAKYARIIKEANIKAE